MEFDENLNPINQSNDSSWGPKKDVTPEINKLNPVEHTDNQPSPIDPPTPTPTPTPPPTPEQPMPMPDPKEDLIPDNHPPRPYPKHKGMVWGLVGIFMIVAIIAIVAISINGSSQTILPAQPSSEQGLRITETGEAYATPDVAKVSFNITTEAKDIATSQKDNSDRTANIKNELVRFNIASADIKTTNYSISPDYDYRIPRLKGYRTNHYLEITIRRLEDTDAIVQTLGNSGITGINQVRFTVDDITEVQNEAREEAIAKAKTKAKQLASLTGAKLGKIISIQENNSSIPPIYRSMSDSAIGFGGKIAETGLEEGSTLITSTITIIYALN